MTKEDGYPLWPLLGLNHQQRKGGKREGRKESNDLRHERALGEEGFIGGVVNHDHPGALPHGCRAQASAGPWLRLGFEPGFVW